MPWPLIKITSAIENERTQRNCMYTKSLGSFCYSRLFCIRYCEFALTHKHIVEFTPTKHHMSLSRVAALSPFHIDYPHWRLSVHTHTNAQRMHGYVCVRIELI